MLGSEADTSWGGASELEEVDEVLWGHRREAAVGVGGRAGVSRVLREEARVIQVGYQLPKHPKPVSKP